MSFLKGFKYAFCGIIHCIKNERNMRFHTVAALYVLIFARFFGFTRTEYLIVLLTIGAVMALEAVNTSIEELCNRVTAENDEKIKRSKDAAAGAVLIMAVIAAAVGVLLFFKPEGWIRICEFFSGNIPALCGMLLMTVVAVIFIAAGPAGMIKPFRKGKRNKEG